ncbi:MAG TPA: TonB-dependent receptor [Hyphomonas adhaerens]|uniref:TonB-dependent receptor n=1 Tax=Hyphomonas adhaerens TaxID=81029 RepID=A0A3B9GV08_9PROT|nr:TonB-dependent receptor [Hyphomonas sp.]MBB40055.1 TonB-dependent receptor [Hyphomonas sp.]HAE26287.1 TonB-dependent receptor [Hyphomonas adhaerens]|tara:strand:- start:1476 stop:3563 length:2088 start_codon:yes stop_codon:yes gene_type:complete
MKQLLLLAASSAVLAGFAHADAPDETDLRQQSVIVTAPGPDRLEGELIGNATAIGRQGIIETLGPTLGDTLDRQPGVSTTFFGQGASRPVLRGLGAERVQVLTNGIGVIDVSAASPDHQAAADGIDAEKIEILRGPAALAYGGQAIGGVVNVIDGLLPETLPEKPVSVDLLGAYNSVSEGTELSGRFQGVQGPIVLTLTASQRDFNDYDIPGMSESARLHAAEEAEEGEAHEEEEHADGTVENSFVNTNTYAGGLSWVGDSAFLGIAVRRQEAQYGLPGAAHEHGDEDGDEGEGEAHGEENPFIDLEQTRYDLRGGIKLDNGFLKEITGTVSQADYEHTEFEAPGEPGTVYKTDGTEARLEASHELGRVKGAFGLQYSDKTLDAFGDEAFITKTDSENVGAFLYETMEWGNGFGLEGGARIEQVTRDNINGNTDFDLFSASLGAHHHWDNGWFVGLQASHTERAPNESELYANGLHLATEQYEVGDINLDKEKGLNLEATARWESEQASFGINLYRTEFDGFVYLAPGTLDGEAVVENLPVYQFLQQDATFTGAEIYGEAYMPQGLLSADWTLDGGIDVVSGELNDGGNVPYMPPLTVNVGTKADWKLWSAAAHVTWADDQNDTGGAELPTDGYTQLDLRADLKLSELGYGREGTTLFVDARNVTDEEIRYATSVLKDKLPAPGRNIRVGIRAVF